MIRCCWIASDGVFERSHDFRHRHDEHGGWDQNELREQCTRQTTTHEPHHGAPKVRLGGFTLDHIVSHHGHLWIDENEHQNRRGPIYNRGQGAGRHP